MRIAHDRHENSIGLYLIMMPISAFQSAQIPRTAATRGCIKCKVRKCESAKMGNV